MEQIKISKIELEIGKNKIALSLAEAHELKKILDDTFPDEKIVYVPGTPIYIERYPQPCWRPYDVWYGSHSIGSETLCLSSNTQIEPT